MGKRDLDNDVHAYAFYYIVQQSGACDFFGYLQRLKNGRVEMHYRFRYNSTGERSWYVATAGKGETVEEFHAVALQVVESVARDFHGESRVLVTDLPGREAAKVLIAAWGDILNVTYERAPN